MQKKSMTQDIVRKYRLLFHYTMADRIPLL